MRRIAELRRRGGRWLGVRAAFGLWIAVGGLAGGGCATYGNRITQIRQAYYGGDLKTADSLAAKTLKSDRGAADVLKLERSLIALSAGRPRDAEQTLREVRDHFDALDRSLVHGAALSYLTDDVRRDYAGEDYEQVLVRAFLAICNLMQDGGDAEAYSLQTIEKQEQIIAAGVDAKGQNAKQNYPRVALAPYLRGVLREATHLNYDDAQRSYVSVVNWQPGFQAGRRDLLRSENGRHSPPGHGVLYLFALTGRGPYKQEAVEEPSTAALLIAGEIVGAVGSQTVPLNLAPVKVPRLVASLNQIQTIDVMVDATPTGATETITDVTALAIQQYEAVYPQIVARAVARRCLKKGMVYGTKEASGIAKGSLPSLAFDLAGMAWEATEAADTRCWGLLPDKIQVVRLELPAGEHEVVLRPVAGGRLVAGAEVSRRVRIDDSRNTYMLANFPETRLVGQVLVGTP